MLKPPRRILIVENEPVLREVLQLIFADEEGYELAAVETIAGAIARLSKETFDLVLTDGFSPTPQGVISVTAPLMDAAGRTPVVLFTAHAIRPGQAAAAGFAAVIAKPFELDALLTQVRVLLG